MDIEQEIFFSIKEIMIMFKVSRQAIMSWITSGELLGYKPGGLWRINKNDLEDFITRRKVTKYAKKPK